MKFLLIDNYDSFTHMLADYIRQCGVDCVVIRNDESILSSQEYVSSFDAIVLSPGPETPSKAGMMMDVISGYYLTKPMLGVCLGHQALGEFFGAILNKSITPKHGKVDEVLHDGNNRLLTGISPVFDVTRYHSLVLENITSPLNVIAVTRLNEVMAIAHNELPLFGIQFHPESCLTPQGLQIIKNYVEIVKQRIT